MLGAAAKSLPESDRCTGEALYPGKGPTQKSRFAHPASGRNLPHHP